jgi:hypothetical protein
MASKILHNKSLSTHTQQRDGNANRLPDVLQFILNLFKLHDNPAAAAATCVHRVTTSHVRDLKQTLQ